MKQPTAKPEVHISYVCVVCEANFLWWLQNKKEGEPAQNEERKKYKIQKLLALLLAWLDGPET